MTHPHEQQLERDLINVGQYEWRPVIAPFLTAHPESASWLAQAIMERRIAAHRALFFVLGEMPLAQWPRLAALALDTYEASGGSDNLAEEVLEICGDDCPDALHDQLDRVFQLGVSFRRHSLPWWRGTGKSHFDYLRGVFEDAAVDRSTRQRAWRAMMATQHADVVEYAMTHLADAEFDDNGGGDEQTRRDALAEYGFHPQFPPLRRLYSEAQYHLQFPGDGEPRTWYERMTLNQNVADFTARMLPFGGVSPSRCCCGEPFFRLLDLAPVPPGLGVTGLDRLEIGFCPVCLQDWNIECYRHNQDGSLEYEYDADEDPATLESEMIPLPPGHVELLALPPGRYWTCWPRNRLGGEPKFLQSAVYLNCDGCRQPMQFLLQFDGGRLQADDSHINQWPGACGFVYVYWCDTCKMSGYFGQRT